jgi:hypothetical protein
MLAETMAGILASAAVPITDLLINFLLEKFMLKCCMV